MIELNVKDFTKAAKIVGAILDRRTTVRALTTMHAGKYGEGFYLIGTDLDAVVSATIPCQPEGSDREFLIRDHRAIVSAIGAAGGETFKIEVEEDKYVTHAGQLRRETKSVIPLDEFPSDMSTPVNPTFTATLSPKALHELERIAVAISTEETRYYLNGIHMKKLDGWTYRFAATDGHRLMFVDLHLPDAVEEFDAREVIIPRKFITQAFANFRNAKEAITMKIGTGAITNKSPRSTTPDTPGAPRLSLSATVGNMDVVMSSKTIDGTYPDYMRVFPSSTDKKAVVNVAKLRQAILAVSASEISSKVKPVKLAFTADRLILFAAFDIDVASTSKFEIECNHNCPEAFTIGFNANYLLDMLAAIRGDEVRLGMTDHASPMTIHDTTDTAFMAVQMPMRV